MKKDIRGSKSKLSVGDVVAREQLCYILELGGYIWYQRAGAPIGDANVLHAVGTEREADRLVKELRSVQPQG